MLLLSACTLPDPPGTADPDADTGTTRYAGRTAPVEEVDPADGADAPLVFNEVAVDRVGSANDPALTGDWVELHNPSDRDVPLDGWTLATEDVGTDAAWGFPAGTTVEAGGWLLVGCEALFEVALDASFPLDLDGDGVWLYDDEGDAVAHLRWTAPPEDGIAFARLPDGDGAWGGDPNPTPGAANAE
ncbi:MAG: lamin tail domain-containing protein [Myxococcota bacterium]